MLINEDKSGKLTEDEYFKALERIDRGEPNSDDVAKVKEILMCSSHLWERGCGLAGSALNYYIERIEECRSDQLFIEAEAKYIKEQLGYHTANQMEKLIIDQILLCWIGVSHLERKSSVVMTNESRAVGLEAYWQNILTIYQKRYLRAIEALARIRKLSKGISFQVNIATNGGQQVNVNSDNPGGGAT